MADVAEAAVLMIDDTTSSLVYMGSFNADLTVSHETCLQIDQ